MSVPLIQREMRRRRRSGIPYKKYTMDHYLCGMSLSPVPHHLFLIIELISCTMVADEKESDTLAYIRQPRNMPEYPICHPYEGTGEGMWKDRYLREDI